MTSSSSAPDTTSHPIISSPSTSKCLKDVENATDAETRHAKFSQRDAPHCHQNTCNDNDASSSEEDDDCIDEDSFLENLMMQKIKEFESNYNDHESDQENKDNEEQNNSGLSEPDSHSSLDKSVSKKKEKKVRNRPTTIFSDPTSKYSREEIIKQQAEARATLPLTLKDHRKLKRKRTEEMEQEQQQKKQKRKAKFKAETYLQNQDPDKMQLYKYSFEMKNLLLKESMSEGEYKRFLRDEYEKQGKQWTGGKIRNAEKNYKELKQELAEKKRRAILERQQARGMGTFSKADEKREKKERDAQYLKKTISFNSRFGAPGSLGRENGKMFRNKALGKGIGRYSKGMLTLSKREINAVSKAAAAKKR